MPETPEQKARRDIDAQLAASGWIVQDVADLDLSAGRGIAVREFPMASSFGFADYLLYHERKALGAVEAKAAGSLSGVEAQSAKYAAGLPGNLPAHRRPLPFLFESNGAVTFFTNGLDPQPRSRKVFGFPRPETLGEYLEQPDQLRARLAALPPLDPTGLWKVQVQAIASLEESLAQAKPRALNRQPSASLAELLEYVAQGGTDPEALTTLAGRLARLQRDFSPAQLDELRELAGGKSFPDLAAGLLHACDPDAQIASAKELFSTDRPDAAQLKQAAERLAQTAVTPFLKAAFRRRILEIRSQNEQTIDRHTVDEVLYSGFDAAALDKAQSKVRDFRAWIDERKDDFAALQALYSGTKPLKVSLKDLRQLKDALSAPPLAASPVQLWRAFEATEGQQAAEPPAALPARPGEPLADLVKLVRHAVAPDEPLAPYSFDVQVSYRLWLASKAAAGVAFTDEQREWLDRIVEHIATSLAIEPEDFELGWFGQHGSLGRAHALFGPQLQPILTELNAQVAA